MPPSGLLYSHDRVFDNVGAWPDCVLPLGAGDRSRAHVRADQQVRRRTALRIIEVICEVRGGKVLSTAFNSVPAFLDQRDITVVVPEIGDVKLDIAYGGAYYAIVSATSIGIQFDQTPIEELVTILTKINDAARASVRIDRPEEPQFAYLFGTILTDDAPSDQATYDLCVFADCQIDRSPTGGGVVSRMARDYARGNLDIGKRRRFYGPTQFHLRRRSLKLMDRRRQLCWSA